MQPLFYFPSTLICIDDNQQSLSSLENIFQSTYKVKTFTSPEESLHFLNHYISPSSQFSLFSPLEGQSHDLDDHVRVDLNLSKIAKLQHAPEKVNEISVLIIDYSMPSLDGLALCRLLKDIPIKKILLTGQKNGAEVVDAFNERIIDNFIRKDSPTLIDDLKKSVAALSTKYFAEQTKPLLMHLETQGQTPLSDKIFAEFFATWCKENDIQEYYLIEQTGSFLCIDSKNNQHYFVVHTEKSLKNIHHHYNELEIKIPDFLTTREKIPFFGSEKYFLPQDAKILATYFHPAKVLEGRGKYYWMVC